jgi:hypothetical protein
MRATPLTHADRLTRRSYALCLMSDSLKVLADGMTLAHIYRHRLSEGAR